MGSGLESASVDRPAGSIGGPRKVQQRVALLSELRKKRAGKVADLARRLRRNYKNVHDDLQLLKRAGLIEEDEQGAFVRYDKIRAEIDLAA